MLYTSSKNNGNPTGYVKINGGGRYLTIPGKWKFDEVTYDKNIVEQEVFHPYTKGGYAYGGVETYGRPKFVKYKDEPQFHWKVLAHGADYFQIHNRATQTCIWMKWQKDKWGEHSNVMEMIPCAGANTGVFRVAQAIPAHHYKVGLPLKQGYGIASSDNGDNNDGQNPNALKCAGLGEGGLQGDSSTSVNWGNCDKLISYNSQSLEYTEGYDTFDYFEDDLKRRRYVSKQVSGNCLQIEDGSFKYVDCDSTDPTQWLLTTQVVGGLSLATPSDQLSGTKLTLGDKFPDPNKILFQPMNPRAGAEWSETVYRYTGTGFDVAYTKAQQATSAINASATAWAAIKTGLAAKSSDLAAGKQVRVKSGNNNYWYRLGPQTGYVAKAVPAGQTPTQLTDGTPIITDDVSDALAKKLVTVATMKEPKWFLCRTKVTVTNDANAEVYFPGVVVNLNNCVFSEGKNKDNSSHETGYFNVVKGGTDLFWQPAGNGYLPSSAVITGRINLDTATGVIDAEIHDSGHLIGSTMAAYSCRAMIGRKTKIGWTIGGEYCHITTFAGGAVVKNFEVLTVNGSIAAPPPPPSPAASCTYQMVQNYYNGRKPSCTQDKYNRLHPDCHFQSRRNGWCDGGPPN